MKARFTPRALLEAERAQAWWRENRPASLDLFDDELAAAIERLCERPTTGALFASRVAGVRRVLLPKTKNHVYYTVEGDEIVVLSVWGAPRQRAPLL